MCDTSPQRLVLQECSAWKTNQGKRTILSNGTQQEKDRTGLSYRDTNEGESLVIEDDNEDFKYGTHGESMFDDENVFPSVEQNNDNVVHFEVGTPGVISQGTIKVLIVQLTSPTIIDYEFVCDFFVSYRMFLDSITLMKLLMVRLIWSLQYLNSLNEENIEIGRLVLLRTFVVLRHWILNYFFDDFSSNMHLCDLFSYYMNRIILGSSLVRRNSMFFEKKVFRDLKCHWLSLLGEYWDLRWSPGMLTEDVLLFKIPLVSQLKKLDKREKTSSVHTKASYRRSALLSMYEQKPQQMNFNVDTKHPISEELQQSITNLLLQHQSKRNSINIKLNSVRRLRKPTSAKSHRALNNMTPQNHLHLQDSSLGLKKISNGKAGYSFHNREDYQEVSNTPEEKEGFSVNGSVKLPSSKVDQILPCTPVKKMECVIRNPNKPSSKMMHNLEREGDQDDLIEPSGRRKSIRKFVGGWKKPFVGGAHGETWDNLSVSKGTSEVPHTVDPEEKSIIGRSDILCSRVIDELEFLIRYGIGNDRTSCRFSQKDATVSNSNLQVSGDETLPISQSSFFNQIEESPLRKQFYKHEDTIDSQLPTTKSVRDCDMSGPVNDSIFSGIKGTGSSASWENPKGVTGGRYVADGYDQKSGASVENCITGASGKESFQGPRSINWSDENALDLENTELKSNKGNDSSDWLAVENDKSLGRSQNLQGRRSMRMSTSSSLCTRNMAQYDADIADLGIAVSPQPLNRLTLESDMDTSGLVVLRNNSNRRDENASLSSYITYDSSNSKLNSSLANIHDQNENRLKKKGGFKNLKEVVGAPPECSFDIDIMSRRVSRSSRKSAMSSNSKSARLSTICALAELPADYFEDRDLLREKYFSSRSFRLLQTARDTIHYDDGYSSSTKEPKEGRLNSLCSSRKSISIPGMNNDILKQLSDIPDESLQMIDPIHFALGKLEGKKLEKLRMQQESDIERSGIENLGNDSEIIPDKTLDIMEAINNAETLDVEDDMHVGNDVTPESPLTPLRRKQSKEGPTEFQASSTPSQKSQNNDYCKNLHYTFSKSLLEDYNAPPELSIESIIENNTHVSFILNYDSRALANALTLIEKDILQVIDWKDLIELRWNKELTPANSWLEIITDETYIGKNRGIDIVIARFNLMVNWIISEILATKGQQERISIISRLIHTAHNCLELQNFASLMQLILALTSEKILKLRETWKNLAPGDILILKNLEEITFPTKNFMNMRKMASQINITKGFIPFLGLYLSNLIFNDERPAIINPAGHGNSNANDSDGFLWETKLNTMINFSKFRTSVHIVKLLAQGIEWSANYSLKVDKELLSRCLYIKSLDEEEMNYCVDHIEEP